MAKTKLTGRKRDERITAYAFTAPAVILLIAFLVVPMIYTVYYSAELIAAGLENVGESVGVIRCHYLLRIPAGNGGYAVGKGYSAL